MIVLLCVLVMRSAVRALLCVDGRAVGETDDVSAVTLPVAGDGAHYISVFPLYGEFVPCVRKAEFEGGRLVFVEDDVERIIWPDCAEIVLPAIQVPKYEKAALLGRVQNDGFTALLFRDCGVHLAIERNGVNELSVTLADGGGGELYDFGETLLAVSEKKAAFVSTTTGELLRLVEGDEFALSGTELTAITRHKTTLRHETAVTVDATSGDINQKRTRTRKRASSGAVAMLALLDALMLGFDDEVQDLLSGELTGLDADELKEFFGDFDERASHPFLQNTVGVRKKGESAMRAFAFEASETDGVWRVENAEAV